MEINQPLLKWGKKFYKLPLTYEEEEDKDGFHDDDEFENITEIGGMVAHSMNIVDSKIFILGSLSQIKFSAYFLDPTTLELEMPENQIEFSKLGNETNFVHRSIVCNNKIYILQNISPLNHKTAVKIVKILDPLTGRVYSIKPDTHPITFRINYTATEYKNEIFVFGGLDHNAEPLNSLEAFDITTYRYTLMST
jgi:hypothetical protein